jgi:mono/diheme cytochrome c family protein
VLSLLLTLVACPSTGGETAETAAETGTPDSGGDTDTAPPVPLTGAELYDEFCVGCHGADGRGVQNRGPGITSKIDEMSDQQIIDVILNGAGRNEMPAIPVTEEEAQRIVDYMRESF